MKKIVTAAIGAALILAACGSDTDVTATDEYVALASQNETLDTDLASTEAELTEVQAELTEVQAELTEVQEDNASLLARSVQSDKERDAAIAEAEALRQQYDPQIRAELQAAVDAEIARATADAIANYDAPIAVNYDQAWEPIISEQAMIDTVTMNAAPERNKSAEEREAERLAAFTTINVDEVVKNPAAYDGQGVIMWARIVQWDVNTGTCSFHANFAAEYSDRSYDYDERAQFGYGDSTRVQSITTDCPALDGIDQDDIVKVWATGAGSYSYSTRVGGTNTVPVFDIDKIELVAKG